MIKVYILGLLNKKAMHGYMIQEELKKGSYESWANVNPNSVYNALKTLEKHKLIELSGSVSNGNQVRSIYNITDLGKSKYYDMLLENISSNKTKFPSDLYISISFLTDLNEEDAIDAISKRIKIIKGQIESWNYGRSIKVKDKNSVLNEIFNNGLNHLISDYDFLQYLKINFYEVVNEIKKLEDEYRRAFND